jgi:hypothetical protein
MQNYYDRYQILIVYTLRESKNRIHPAPIEVATAVALIQARKPMASTTSVVKTICTSWYDTTFYQNQAPNKAKESKMPENLPKSDIQRLQYEYGCIFTQNEHSSVLILLSLFPFKGA